jgi:hypothetical protein
MSAAQDDTELRAHIQVIKSHPQSLNAVKEACIFITRSCPVEEDAGPLREYAKQAGAIDALYHILQLHKDNAEVQQVACTAIATLSQEGMGTTAITTGAMASTMIDCMQRYANKSAVLASALSALVCLTAHASHVLEQKGIIKVTLAAMRRHKHNLHLQALGSTLISNFLACTETVHTLHEQKGQ